MSAASATEPNSGARLLLAGGIGAAIALSLGIYGNAHDPATDLSSSRSASRTPSR